MNVPKVLPGPLAATAGGLSQRKGQCALAWLRTALDGTP